METKREKRYKEFWNGSVLDIYVYHCELPKGCIVRSLTWIKHMFRACELAHLVS